MKIHWAMFVHYDKVSANSVAYNWMTRKNARQPFFQLLSGECTTRLVVYRTQVKHHLLMELRIQRLASAFSLTRITFE